ncbi:lipopolysaccharide biosynthesis protein [Pedobacter gandavensis]|uniref:Lipopolysaccharide biosynthesis protein n=1 Tax=Pedobacter gandavensis TaxID=2679963 RepID=A0ABR6EXY5_9SPHI|nr:lipopolysaccharide biosynthesis protein [Pedobacter gandavensis]MBB2149892.1 lipopolysaccharide biosynthesis protein [Pedobacter gandavensis]
MGDLKGKSILLFCPMFFEYEREIIKALEDLGAKVIWFDDRPSNDFFSKAIIRVNKGFLKNRIYRYYNEILSRLKNEEKDFDYLFFVNPEAITKDVLQQFKTLFPTAKCLLYMWDSFKNRKQNIELLPFFDDKFTFDPVDAKAHDLKLRPLFYTTAYAQKNVVKHHKYDLLFIGTAHSDRYILVKNITANLKLAKSKLYFYLGSKMLFFAKKVTDKEFRDVNFKDISFESLTHTNIFNLMSQSKSILDINHPQQKGLTMRTFEALGANIKLITTNPQIVNYDFYNPNNVLLIDRTQPDIDSKFFEGSFIVPSPEMMSKYSIKGWAKEIFSIV